jgi:hypothetical protein
MRMLDNRKNDFVKLQACPLFGSVFCIRTVDYLRSGMKGLS